MTGFLAISHGICIVGLLLITGCGSSTGTVSGIVTYRGTNVPSGTVSFFSQGIVVESPIHDGAYQVHGLPIGKASITVVRLDPHQPDPLDALKLARKQSAEHPAQRIDHTVTSDPVRLAAIQKKRHLLPYEYSSFHTTNLRYTVAPGIQSYDIRLID